MYKLHNGSILIVIVIIKHGSKFSVICFRAHTIVIMLKRITVKVMAKFIPELMGICILKKGHSLYDLIKVGFMKKCRKKF